MKNLKLKSLKIPRKKKNPDNIKFQIITMKKRISTFLTACCILSLFPIATSAQTVSESRMNVLESDRMGHIVIFNFEQKILQDAWNKKCEEFKIKSKPSKGLDVYTTVLVPDIHFEPVDIYEIGRAHV